MDNTLLKQLIAQHKRVVIPDFGAFLKKETPEGEQVVFSPFLRKDDGIVTEALAAEYGVETEDAQSMLSEFTAHLRQTLANAGRYEIEGIGMLTTDANGVITLKEEESIPVVETEPEPEETEEEEIPEPTPAPAPQRPQTIQVQGAPQSPPPVQAAEQPRPFGQPVATTPPPPRPSNPIQNIPQQGTLQPPTSQQRVFSGFPSQRQQGTPPQQPSAQRPSVPNRPPVAGPTVPPSQGSATPGMQPPQRAAQPPVPQAARPPRAPRPGQAPPRRRPAPKSKTDIWLIVAIVAALIVIGIMIYGFIATSNSPDMRDFDTMTPQIETLQDTEDLVPEETL